MGLMDKVKAQASTLAQQANAGMAKLDNLPAQRKADALLRSLGLAILAERTGRATAETSGEIDRLLAEIAQHETQNNVNLVQQAAQAAAQQMQAQQMRAQMQGPGEFLSSSPAQADPNVSATMPGSPAGFPQQGGPAGFPQQAGPTGFPQQAGPTGFPQQGGPTGFPGPSAPPPAAPASFPQSGGPTGFPEAVPATSFPAASPVGFPEPDAEPAREEGQESGGASGFPPASGV